MNHFVNSCKKKLQGDPGGELCKNLMPPEPSQNTDTAGSCLKGYMYRSPDPSHQAGYSYLCDTPSDS